MKRLAPFPPSPRGNTHVVFTLALLGAAFVLPACGIRTKGGSDAHANDGNAGSAGSAETTGSGGSGGVASSEEDCGGGGGGGWQLDKDGEPPPAAAGDPATLLKDLSDSEAQAWCEWYVAGYLSTGNGLPVAENDPVNESQGYVQGLSAMFCDANGAAGKRCFSLPKVSDCVRNLRRSPCAAPASLATDCVTSYFDPIKHYDCPVTGCGSACDTLMTTEGCNGTILSIAQGATCPLAVE